MNFPFLAAKERLIRIMGTFDLATGHADTFDELLDSLESELRDVLGHYREQRKWVPLTEEEATALWEGTDDRDSWELIMKVQKALKEKNTWRRTVDKLPEEVLLAKQLMKLIGKRNPQVVLKAIMIVLKTTEIVGGER